MKKQRLIIKIIINICLLVIFYLIFLLNNQSNKEFENIKYITSQSGITQLNDLNENTISINTLSEYIFLFIIFGIILFIANIIINSYLKEGKIGVKKGKIIRWFIILFVVYIIYSIVSWFLNLAMPCACL